MGRYAKSIVAALVAGLGALQTAMQDDVVTHNEWIAVASATVAALGLVWGVQNKPTPTPPAGTADDGEVIEA